MRLKKDSTSWKSRSIVRRDYRHTPLTPDEEAPRHRKTKKGKKKHEHTFETRIIGGKIMVSHVGRGGRVKYETDKKIYVCTGCGYKRTYRGW